MKFEILTLTEKAQEKRDYSNEIMIKVDGEDKFHVYDGEIEDNNLLRNFSDCFKIDELMQLAYEAGRENKELVFELKEVEEID